MLLSSVTGHLFHSVLCCITQSWFQKLHMFDPYVLSGCFTVWVQEPGQRERVLEPLAALEAGGDITPADCLATTPGPGSERVSAEIKFSPGWKSPDMIRNSN